MSMHRKKTKQRQFRPCSMGLLREASPVENRVHIRQSIIDELDMIKTRVDQILQNFEEENELYMPKAAAISIPVKTLENLFKKHEALGARREKELSSVKDFFKRCLERFFDEAAATELNYDTSEHQVPDIHEFVSAIQNAFQMVHQLKTLNAKLVAKMSDALKRKDLQPHLGNGDSGVHNSDQILTMYTNEAVKCGRLEKTIKGMTEELENLKTYNSYLMQRNETDKSKLGEIEVSNKELAETVQKLRTEINSLKHKTARRTATPQNVNHHITSTHPASRQFSQADKNETSHAATSQTEVALHKKTIIIPSTSTKSQQKEEKEEQVPTAVTSKKQSSAKHASRLLEQQLNTMEELLMQGQKKMNAVEKEITELTSVTDETLSHKYREQYNCLCEAVDVIMILLGREGSEKLMMTLSNAAPNIIFGDKKLIIPINKLADIIKTAVSRVMLELKLFIKLKRKLAAVPNKKTLLTSEEAKKSINELQKWLDNELKGIDEEIVGSVQHFEQHKKEIEITQEEYFDQLSKKVDGTIHKLYKTMEKLEVPDEIESMLGNILTTVEQLNDNPVSEHKPHLSPTQSTEEERLATNTVGGNASWLSALSIPAIDAIRKNVAGHLRAKHGVNISSTSWRTKAYKKKERPQPNYQDNTPNRKFLMPSLANCVDFSANSNFNFSNKPPSNSPLEAVHLPTIDKQQQTRRLSEVLQQTMHPYVTRHTPTTANATRIFARKRSQMQKKTTDTFPHVENAVTLTGPKGDRLWH